MLKYVIALLIGTLIILITNWSEDENMSQFPNLNDDIGRQVLKIAVATLTMAVALLLIFR